MARRLRVGDHACRAVRLNRPCNLARIVICFGKLDTIVVSLELIISNIVILGGLNCLCSQASPDFRKRMSQYAIPWIIVPVPDIPLSSRLIAGLASFVFAVLVRSGIGDLNGVCSHRHVC